MFEVEVSARALSPFVELVGPSRVEEITRLADATRAALGGHRVWNINSTAAGGGVAEILRSLLRYSRGLGFDVRWLVLEGPPEFFAVTKRLHNALHDNAGDGSPLGAEQVAIYERVLAANFAELERRLRPGDAVVCHDPQTAGLIPHLRHLGGRVIWRCHIGHEGPGAEVERGWSFLRKYLEDVAVAVFSRSAYAPTWFPRRQTVTIPPNIDPFSVKNQWMASRSASAMLATAGIIEAPGCVDASIYVGEDGTPRRMSTRARIMRTGAPPSAATPLVVQVSRWDRMKDHVGVLEAFAALLARGDDTGAELVLAGPSATGVADDPEGPAVLAEIERAFRAQPERVRRRVHVVELPMTDNDENAALVNALQRHAAIIVQKSLREGFGLTVTEAMWKGRPIVASAVGGIQDQLRDGVEGLLVHDPLDHEEAANALARLLGSRELSRRLGSAAYERAREHYLSITALKRWGNLLRVLFGRAPHGVAHAVDDEGA